VLWRRESISALWRTGVNKSSAKQCLYSPLRY